MAASPVPGGGSSLDEGTRAPRALRLGELSGLGGFTTNGKQIGFVHLGDGLNYPAVIAHPDAASWSERCSMPAG